MHPTVAVASPTTQTGVGVMSGARLILHLSGWVLELSVRSSAQTTIVEAGAPIRNSGVSALLAGAALEDPA